MYIPTAKKSPRIEDGVIKWYEGDTFTLALIIKIRDDDGPIDISNTDIILCKFYNDTGNVETLEFTNIEDNVIYINVDDTLTKKFPQGLYKYDIVYVNENKTTLCKTNYIEVE